MLGAMGVDDLVARDDEDFVAKALALGRDPGRRDDVARRIRSSRDILFGRDEPIRALEDFLRRAAGS